MSATVKYGMCLTTTCYIWTVPKALDDASVIELAESCGSPMFATVAILSTPPQHRRLRLQFCDKTKD